MKPQQSEAIIADTTALSSIRRAHSAPKLSKNVGPFRSPDVSALVTAPLSTRDSSSGDEAVCIKPKGRAQLDCNICFDAAREPVVTQCGHLYCWQCLYQVTPFEFRHFYSQLFSGYHPLQLHRIRLVRHASLVAKFRRSYLSTEEVRHLLQDQGAPHSRPLPRRRSNGHYDLPMYSSFRILNHHQQAIPFSLHDHKLNDSHHAQLSKIHHFTCFSNPHNNIILFFPKVPSLLFHKVQRQDSVNLIYSCSSLQYGLPCLK